MSLYEDAVPPTHGSLKGRLGELEQEPRVWACGTTTGVADLEVSKNFLAMSAAARGRAPGCAALRRGALSTLTTGVLSILANLSLLQQATYKEEKMFILSLARSLIRSFACSQNI